MAKKTTQKSTSSGGNSSDDFLAVVAYLTLIGWIIAFVLNREKNNALVRYHEKQSLMVMIVSLVLSIIPVIGWLISIVLWIMGLLNAVNKVQKPVPVIGKLAEEHFKW